MTWKKRDDPKAIRISQAALSVVLIVLLALAAFMVWSFSQDTDRADTTETVEPTIQIEETPDPAMQRFDAQEIQSAVDTWVNSVQGDASVVVADTSGNVLAAYNADQVYFAASLYKLYVAYEGYKEIDAGQADGDEQYLNGNTRLACLDLMIRESNSPCAEKLWEELGKLELTNTLRTYGITNTSMTNISTTATDAATLLSLVARGEGLSEESQAAYLDSMKTQDDVYRRGLPSGFSDEFIVYNKVGWNELVEWHDAAIVELPDGEQVIVTVLTENVGTTRIRELAQALEPVLLAN